MDAQTNNRSVEGDHTRSVLGRIGNLAKWLCLIVLFALCSCTPKAKQDTFTKAASANLRSVVEHSSDSAEDITRDANQIIKDVVKAEESLDEAYEVLPPEGKPAADSAYKSLQSVNSRALNILEAAEDLEKEIQKVETLVDDVDDLEKSLTQLSSAVESARVKALEKLYGYITMFWVIGFSMIAAGGAIAFFLNKTYGVSLSILGVLMIGFASASQYYMEQIAQVGAILLIASIFGAVASLGWQMFKKKQTDQAMKEVVEMIEILRETMTDDERARIFGPEGLASKVQSDFTKKLVYEIKQRNGFNQLKEVKGSNATQPEQQP